MHLPGVAFFFIGNTILFIFLYGLLTKSVNKDVVKNNSLRLISIIKSILYCITTRY